uniref:Uncharacterized protein n=1 Tax=Leersia perrieri TaxID=77586 RepID=A0A0D9V1E4_9ORYZ
MRSTVGNDRWSSNVVLLGVEDDDTNGCSGSDKEVQLRQGTWTRPYETALSLRALQKRSHKVYGL